MIEIITSDKGRFILEEKVAYKSALIRNVSSLAVCNYPIPLQISSPVFDIVHRYMKTDTAQLSDDYNPLEIRFKPADFDFFAEYDDKILLDICNAANYLEYLYLLELCCKIISGRMRYKSIEELKEFIGFECDMTETDLAEIDREFEWMSSEE